MASVRPFPALRPPPHLAPRVAAPPYDVVTTAEARTLAAGNPNSFLHVSRPEIDLPEGTDEHSAPVYEQGQRNLAALLEREVLAPESQPRLYLYAQHMGSHRQCGVVACAAVQDYLDNTIKKHEKTRPDQEDDRTRHIAALGAHDEPVFLTYRAVPAIDATVARVRESAPIYDFTSPDGVRHVCWVVPQAESEQLIGLFDGVETLFVADGHHRSAAAARVHALCGEQPGEHDAFLAVIFPHDQMQILAYNRVVRDSRRRSSAELLARFQERFQVQETDCAVPDRARCFTLFLGGRWYRLTTRPETVDEADPVASLDASICQDQILAPLFGIHDPRTDQNVGFVGGIRGSGELERLVRGGEWDLGLHLFPTSIEQLIAVSEADRLMPPKSTWFEPKLRSGLFVHQF